MLEMLYLFSIHISRMLHYMSNENYTCKLMYLATFFYRIHSSFTKTDTRKLICIISFLYRTLIIVCWRDGDLNDRHIFKIKRVEKILQIMLLFKSKKWTTYVHINSMWCFFKYTKEVQIESTHFKNSTTGSK